MLLLVVKQYDHHRHNYTSLRSPCINKPCEMHGEFMERTFMAFMLKKYPHLLLDFVLQAVIAALQIPGWD